MTDLSNADQLDERTKKKIFWTCFIALVATSFFFGLRSVIVGDLRETFNLSGTQIGTILGVGLWPFAFSIIVFSLIIDKIGYKTAAYFAVISHAVAVIGTLFAIKNGSTSLLYWSTFLVAIANGTVEAFINPVVATIFNKEKSKWLNILHAGWPAGLALGGAAGLLLNSAGIGLFVKMAVCLVPVVFYALLIVGCNFPVQERVAAGVTYRDMLREVGAIGFFMMAWLVVIGIGQVMNQSVAPTISLGVAAIVAVLAFIYTRSLGNWMFVLILATMPFLATTELGTDAWMAELLSADLPKYAGWVFVMVSVIMTILRFYAGPIVHKFSPIGLLVVSGALAIVGLLFLGVAPAGLMVVAAIVYAFGKTFLWSTTLGVVSEQFPKGGALTLNGVSAVGVLGMGILGAPLMGLYLDKGIDQDLQDNEAALYQIVDGGLRKTMFGESPSLNMDAVEALSSEGASKLGAIVNSNKKQSFIRQATLPGLLLVCYLILFFYFKSRGGYKPIDLHGQEKAEEAEPGF
ncbi:MAG: MFS transporter [Opitutales bacterium]|nr:MFS transporter [Opitutales bacterium]